MSWNIYGINEGGHTILYPDEDPYVREYFKQRLAEEGAPFQMPDYVYDKNYKPSAEQPLVYQR